MDIALPSEHREIIRYDTQKKPFRKKKGLKIHLSPSRRRAFRREIVQTGRVVQTKLQTAPYLSPRRPVAIARCERK